MEKHEKYQEAFCFLVACIIEKYSENDLLRYFFPQGLSQKESRPESSDHSSRMSYCFQLIGYWLRQLFNKPIYKLNAENSSLTHSVEQLKLSLKKEPYVENSVNVAFRMNLSAVLIQFEKKFSNLQKEIVSEEIAASLIEREKTLARLKEELSEQKRLWDEKLEGLIKSEEGLQERTALHTQDKEEIEKQIKALEKENTELKGTISDLRKVKLSEKAYICYLEGQCFQSEEKNKALELAAAKEFAFLPQASQNTEAEQDVQATAIPTKPTKLCRTQSCASFFSFTNDKISFDYLKNEITNSQLNFN